MRRKRFWAILLFSLLVHGTALAGSQQTSGVTTQDIINRARDIINETYQAGVSYEDYWTDAELLDHLNNGLIYIAGTSYCLQTTETITLIPNVTEYALSTAYFDVETAIYNGGTTIYNKGLVRGNPQSVGNVQDAEEPVYWYEWGGKIGFYPADYSSATSGYRVTVYLFERPTARTLTGGTSVVPTPALYDYPLVLFVAGNALRKLPDEVNRGNALIGEATQLLTFYNKMTNRREKESEDVIK